MNNKWSCSLSASALAARRWALCGLAGLALGAGVLGAAMQAGGGRASAQGVASLLVTTTRDGGAGSLRAAILAANQRAGSTITFAIPRGDSGFRRGVWTILLRRSLPPVSAARTTIDGASQTRFGGNTNLTGPEIEIFGGDIQTQVLVPTVDPTLGATATSAPTVTPTPTAGPTPTAQLTPSPTPLPTPTPTPSGRLVPQQASQFADQQAIPTATPAPSFEEARPNGLTITAPFATVRGLAINGFGGNGVEFRPDTNGTLPRLLGGNFGRVEGCTIGLEAQRMQAKPNLGTGIFVQSVIGTTVGSPQAERNLIAGNGRNLFTVVYNFSPAFVGTFTTVQNNWFGLNATGEVLASRPEGSDQRTDVFLSTPMRFGGTRASERNVVARDAVLRGVGTIENNVFGFSASGRLVMAYSRDLIVDSSGSGTLLLGGATARSRNYTASCQAYGASPRGMVLQNNWLGWSPANISTGSGLLTSENAQVGAAPADPAPALRGNRLAGPVYISAARFGQAGASAASTVRGNVLTSQQGSEPIVYGNSVGDGIITPNDFRDADVGVNGLQNAPVLGEARQSPRGLKLSLGLHSRPSTSYILDFYAFNTGTRTWTPLASRLLRTGAGGDVVTSLTLPSSPTSQVACMATDLSTGATSPMSNLAAATEGDNLPEPTLVLYVTPNFGVVGQAITISGRGLDRVSDVLFTGSRGLQGEEMSVSARFTIVNGQAIRAVIPEGAQSGPLKLVLPGGRTLAVRGTFSIIAPDDNDFFSQARILNGLSGAVQDAFGRSAEAGEPAHAGQPAVRSQWFRWTAPRDGLSEWLLGPVANRFSSGRLAVYTGSSLGSLRPVASRTGNVFLDSFNGEVATLNIQFEVRAGTTYFIAADSPDFTTFVLAWRYATEIERSRAPKPSAPPPSIKLSSARASELQILARSRATIRDPRSS